MDGLVVLVVVVVGRPAGGRAGGAASLGLSVCRHPPGRAVCLCSVLSLWRTHCAPARVLLLVQAGRRR